MLTLTTEDEQKLNSYIAFFKKILSGVRSVQTVYTPLMTKIRKKTEFGIANRLLYHIMSNHEITSEKIYNEGIEAIEDVIRLNSLISQLVKQFGVYEFEDLYEVKVPFNLIETLKSCKNNHTIIEEDYIMSAFKMVLSYKLDMEDDEKKFFCAVSEFANSISKIIEILKDISYPSIISEKDYYFLMGILEKIAESSVNDNYKNIILEVASDVSLIYNSLLVNKIDSLEEQINK